MGSVNSTTGALVHRPPWWVYLLLAAVIYFPLFLHLDVLPLRIWDEARQAINAYEMIRSGDLLVTRFYGDPEMWSTKPPLLIWFQAFCYLLIGPSELALRLPVAIAALVICYSMLRTTWRHVGDPWLGIIGVLILVTTPGFIALHIARTGDFDVPLSLFMLLGAFSILQWTAQGGRRPAFTFFLFLSCAVLTKSVQGLLFIPGIGLFLLAQGKLRAFLRERGTWYGILVLLMIVAGFYLGREAYNPGYLQAVWENELGGRYSTVLEEHKGPWNFYLLRLLNTDLIPWWWLVLPGLLIGLFHQDLQIRRWTGMFGSLALTYLIIISGASTKLEWYSAPLYPVFAALAAVPIHFLFTVLFQETWTKGLLRGRVLPYILLFVVFLMPYSATIACVYFPKERDWDGEIYGCAYAMQEALRTNKPFDVDAVCYDAYNAHLMFYIWRLNDRGDRVQSISKVALKPGMKAIASEAFVRSYIESNYLYELESTDGPVNIYLIKGSNNVQ